MSKIFISYRRLDSGDVTGRIYDHLCQKFRSDDVFKDVDSIPLGTDFRSVITNTVQSCDVAVVIIGKDWLTATNSKGMRRLDDPDDFVRLEIEGALKRKIPLIPVLVRGAELPSAEDLPQSLRDLVFRNAIKVRPDPDFKNDVGRLVRALEEVVKGNALLDRVKNVRRGQIVVVAGLLLAVLITIPVIKNLTGRTDTTNQNKTSETPSPTPTPTEDEGIVEENPTSPAATVPAKVVAYDESFLPGFRVPLPVITDEISRGDLLNGQVFDYMHYSLVINERRGMPLYTACNIDGATLQNVRRERDQWKLDSRVPRDLQKGDDVYVKNDWDRGHIVQRSAVAWGTEEDAKLGAESVFFFPNSVPQHSTFNQGIWNRLENYILELAKVSDMRISVLAGPVFRSSDYEYRGSRIPQSFWKIVCFIDPQTNRPAVSAYLMDQYTLSATGDIQTDNRIGPGSFDPKIFQVSVEKIESLTPLQFGTLKRYDTYKKQ
jgi:DNA/RNA endonuclease G (NUC1)